jgi:hypothetical protein
MHQPATQTTAAVAAVLHAIGGDGPLAPGVLAADPIVSIADSDRGLPPRALVTRDAGEAGRALGALGLGTATPVIAVADGAVTFVEARTSGSGAGGLSGTPVDVDGAGGGHAPGSLVLTATHDDAGRIARLVVLTGAAVDPPSSDPADHDGTWSEIAPLLDRYFHDLEASDFPAAAAWFSPDCLYSHPPYAVDDARVDFRGRAALLDGFVYKRGKTSSRHGILRVVQEGRHGFVEGFAGASHISDGSTFLSSISLDGEGRIERYVAYYAAPRVPDA